MDEVDVPELEPPSATRSVRETTRAIVAHGEIGVAYQPIVDVASQEVFGYEALGRCAPWSPADLLDAAHDAGCLLALDRRWRMLAIEGFRHVPAPARCFLNVDARVADDPSFAPGFTSRRIEEAALTPDRFVLELTEREGTRPGAIELVLAHYAKQGFAIALDDVGARGQSFERVLSVRPSLLKIDGTIVRAMRDDPAAREMVRSLISIGGRLGARTVAEGVESDEDLVNVVRAGVGLVQGFGVGRPSSTPCDIAPEVRHRLRAALALRKRRLLASRDAENALLEVLDRLRAATSLEAALDAVTEGATQLLGTQRASLRLLDERRRVLRVVSRSGAAVHEGGGATFDVGEGLVGWVAQENRPLRLGAANEDPRFTLRPAASHAVRSFLGVPLADPRRCIGVLATTSAERDAFDEQDETRLRLLASLSSPTLEIYRLRRLAETDALTGLSNRHALSAALPARDDGSRSGVAVVLLDVDHFKRINDHYGHPVGDLVLRHVAQEIRAAVRTDDYVLRLGGEEFLVVSAESMTLDEGATLARTICRRVADTVSWNGAPITMSAGVALRAAGEPRERLLARADAALYDSKRAGRDRVSLAPASVGP